MLLPLYLPTFPTSMASFEVNEARYQPYHLFKAMDVSQHVLIFPKDDLPSAAAPNARIPLSRSFQSSLKRL